MNIKKRKKTRTLGFRLSESLRQDMEICKELYGLSFSNQVQIGVKNLHRGLSDEEQNIKNKPLQRMASRFSSSNEALDKED